MQIGPIRPLNLKIFQNYQVGSGVRSPGEKIIKMKIFPNLIIYFEKPRKHLKIDFQDENLFSSFGPKLSSFGPNFQMFPRIRKIIKFWTFFFFKSGFSNLSSFSSWEIGPPTPHKLENFSNFSSLKIGKKIQVEKLENWQQFSSLCKS